MGVGMVNFVMTILRDVHDRPHWGRRPLLVLGFVGTAATHAADCSSRSCYPSVFPSWIVIVMLLFYIASFAISLGPLPHVMMSEIFPLRVRGPGMSMASVSNWGFNFMVVFAFPMHAGRHQGIALTFTAIRR